MSELLNSGFDWEKYVTHSKKMVKLLSQQLKLDPGNNEIEGRL